MQAFNHNNVVLESTIKWMPFSEKHKKYIRDAYKSKMSVAEGAVRCGKTIDHCIIAAMILEVTPDKIHLASGSTIANAKLNIGDCNGFGLEYLFRGRCKWGKYKDNEALYIETQTGTKIVIFAGGSKADSYKKILGNSYGLWIGTEINEHYDCDDSKTSFIKVAMARQVAAKFPKILWDLNPSNPKARIYTDYIDRYQNEGLLGGYNYQHFTIRDNLSISPERRKELESQYGDVNSVWYRRDILGQRCVAEGLCYQMLADNPEEFILDKVPPLSKIVVGIDFGGTKSAHSFTATGYGYSFAYVVVLECKPVDAHGVTPDQLDDKFEEFIENVKMKYGFNAIMTMCDSAEQTLINGFDYRSKHKKLGAIIKNAIKSPINDRIRLVNKLLNQHRIYWMRNSAQASLNAMSSCCYSNKEGHEDERLDNGTTPIDDVDSTEYTIEVETKNLQRVIEMGKKINLKERY